MNKLEKQLEVENRKLTTSLEKEKIKNELLRKEIRCLKQEKKGVEEKLHRSKKKASELKVSLRSELKKN